MDVRAADDGPGGLVGRVERPVSDIDEDLAVGVLAGQGIIDTDYTVGLDPAYPNPAPDEVYVRWEVTLVDTMERIFSTVIVR